MAGFVYYLPDQETLTLEAARTGGFAYALEGPEIHARGVARGPDKSGAGVIFGDPERVEQGRIGFWPDRQRWRKYPGRAGVYVGLDRERPPKPQDLARRDQLSGHLVELADGQKWLAPIARGQVADQADDSPAWYCALPAEITVDDDGLWTAGDVLPRYAELWRRALAFWDYWSAEIRGEQADTDWTEAQLSDLALLALGTNYVIGKAELRLLGLFDPAARMRVLSALVDWPTLRTWLKKKRQAASSDAT